MQTITIVLEGGLVQSVYAADSNTRVIVLDLDIEGSDPDDPRIYRGTPVCRSTASRATNPCPMRTGRRLRNS